MKKTIAFLFAGLVASVGFAGMNNLTVSFKADKITYADGTPALDGECCALVHVAKGKTLTTINANGTANAGCKFLMCAPAIRAGGRVPRTLLQVDESLVPSSGTIELVFLDTRRYKTAEDGTILPEVDAVGFSNTGVINGFVTAASNVGGNQGAANVSGLKIEIESGTPANCPDPKITNIRVVGDKVFITVENTVPYMKYEVGSGSAPDNIQGDGAARYGSEKGSIVIIKDAKPEGEMFGVGVAK